MTHCLRSPIRRRALGFFLAEVALIGTLIMTLLSGCSPFAWQSQVLNPQIHIGLIVSLTGELATNGQPTVRGAELAVEEVNQAGGLEVNRRKYAIVLQTEDDHDEVDTAVNAARKLIYQDNAIALVGPQLSRNAIPVAKLAESAQIPMISPLSTSPETTQGKRYVFRATFTDLFQGQVMARFARADLKARTAAVLYDIASPYNQGIAAVFRQIFEAKGGKVVAFESYTTGETDFSTQLATIRSRQPDVLFLPNYYYELPLQAAQARQIGIKATLLGSDTWNALTAEERQPLEGTFFSNQFAPDSSHAQTQAFMRRYQQRYGEAPDTAAAVTYDTLHLLFQAIQRQGKIDPDSIREGLAQLGRFEGVTGAIEYRGTGDPLRSVVILQIKNGQPVFYKQVDP